MSKYNKEYFENLDRLVLEDKNKKLEYRKHAFIKLTFDKMFKSVMRRNPDIFKEFILNTINIKLDDKDNYLMFLDKELIKGNISEKGKVLDFVVSIGKNLLIDIEVNRSKYEVVQVRNDYYLDKLEMMQLEVSDEYIGIEDVNIYQLNLNASNKEDSVKKRIIEEYDTLNHAKVKNRKRKILLNLVNYKKIFYNEKKEMTYDEIFMAGLMSDNYTELYTIMSKILSEDKLNRFMESVMSMSIDWKLFNEWENEMFDNYERKKEKILNIKEGRAEGRAEGIAEGRTEGQEEKTNEIIMSMIKNNYSNEEISKITGKDYEYIDNIRNV